jgi:demethylmenaquinone methyltransferase/2-methoxy-6-polyprenyl-1,4-benzoquinol methylase
VDDSARLNAGGKSPAEVREMFARVSPRYDLLNHLLSLGRDIHWRSVAAREAAGLCAKDVIVDLCTGTGDLAFTFHRTAPEARIIGLDFTPEMVELALRKAERKQVHAAPFEGQSGVGEERGMMFFGSGDAMAVPMADDSAALASVAFGLRNVADPERALREMVRLVRPGGKVLVLEFTRPRGRFFGRVYMFYFRHILPLLGRLVAAGAGDAYRYLPQSVEAFAGPEEMAARFRALGLRDVRAVALTFGVVHLYAGVK